MPFFNSEYEHLAQQLPQSYLNQLKHRFETTKVRGIKVNELPDGLKSIHSVIEEAFEAEVARITIRCLS